ncbi:MAG: hypothetical protein COB53_12025 [Elusimicrobia bacterium]|nr:MAG: hypothetical protein COB53_12025 [Elusimicrobiota bacterium]
MAQKASAGIGQFATPSAFSLFSLCAAVIAVLLSFSARNTAHFSLPKLVYGTTGALAAAGAALFFSLRGTRPLVSSPMDAPVFGMVGAVLVSTVFSIDPIHSLEGIYKFYGYGLTAVVVYALFYIAASQLREQSHTRMVSKVLVICGAIAGVYSILQGFGLDPFYAFTIQNIGRSISLFGNPVYAIAVFVLILPLALREAEEKSPEAWIFVGAALLIIAGLYFAKSRGGWVSGGVGIGMYVWASGRLDFLRGRRLRVVIATLSVVGFLGIAGLISMGGKKQSDRGRMELWRSSLSVFNLSPVIGVGPAVFSVPFMRVRNDGFIRVMGSQSAQAHSHNDFLESLTTTGLLGFGIYLWLLVWIYRSARAGLQGPRRNEAAAYVSGLTALFLQAKVNPIPLAALAAAAIIVGLLASLSRKPLKTVPSHLLEVFVGILLLFATGLCARAWRNHRADRFMLKGEVYAHFKHHAQAEKNYAAGIAENPRENVYRLDWINYLILRAKTELDPDRKKSFLLRALEHAEDTVRLGPMHYIAYQMLGLAHLRLAEMGRPGSYEKAAAALDRSLELAPRFEMTMRIRLQVAEGVGDAATAGRLRSAIVGLRRKPI